MCFIIILFFLPPVYPITAVTMNYVSVGVGSVILFAGLAYFVSAKYCFQGPITNVNCNRKKRDVVVAYL
jgi:hypothetical protein